MTVARRSSHSVRPSLIGSAFRICARLLWALFILSAMMFAGGFLVYTSEYQRVAKPSFDRADAIVVLTGGPDRIAEGARLLASQRANHLLISGVNEQTDEDDLVRIVPTLEAFMACCVTVDRSAMNTRDNAIQTLSWSQQKKINSIILVTAHAHLPRALFEFGILDSSQLAISPWRVGGPEKPEDWWHDMITIRSMLVEYTKLVGSVLRYLSTRIAGSHVSGSENVKAQ